MCDAALAYLTARGGSKKPRLKPRNLDKSDSAESATLKVGHLFVWSFASTTAVDSSPRIFSTRTFIYKNPRASP